MRYDAFISYRHGELDGLVAEKLHKLMETYRIPGAIAKKVGRKKLARVFRDREELPTSSNLSDSINEALENSDYLLLVCSRRTCASQWVMREVERFGELRGKDKIITLLIDGEPDESFPPGLREREVGGTTIFVEPLAADIRADTWAGSIKMLKEEKLRLLAPVLGCAFDDLRRRHRRRQMQRVAAVIGAVLAFTLSFGSFSTWQYIRIGSEMQLKLENQSYVLSEYSETALKDGDRDMALLLALAALPNDSGKPDRPFVRTAQRALSDALGIFDVSEGYKPHKALTLPVAPGKVLLSPNGKYTAAIYPFELAIFDTESGERIATLPTIRSVLADMEFLTDTVIVFAGENGVSAYDIENGYTLWSGAPATKLAVSGDKTVVAAVYKDENKALLYAPDGHERGEIGFGGRVMRNPADNSFLNPHDTLFELSETGGKLAVSFADGSLYIFAADTGAGRELYAPSNAVNFAGGFCSNTPAFSVVEKDPYISAFLVFDAKDGEILSRFESDTSRFIPYTKDGKLYVAFEDQIMSVNTETGAVSHVASAGGSVEAFVKSGDTILICESGGSYRFVNTGDAAYARSGPRVYHSDYICQFADIGSAYALTGSRDSKILRILKNEGGHGERLFTYDTSYVFSEAKINPGIGRAVFYSYRGLRLCSMDGTVLAEVMFPDPLAVLDTQYDETSGNVAVLYADALRLYSGLDASLLLEKPGRQGGIFYTPFGVSVLDEYGDVSLYNMAQARTVATGQSDAGADSALLLPEGGCVSVRQSRVLFGGREIAAGGLIGGGQTADGGFAFAVSNGAEGRVFFVKGGVLSNGFAFPALGEAEAYFIGDIVFISPTLGDAVAYSREGRVIRTFTENGYMADAVTLGEYVIANYVMASSTRVSFLLAPDTLETAAVLPGFLGVSADGALILNDTNGSLHAVKLPETQELVALARKHLSGRALTPEEKAKFKAG